MSRGDIFTNLYNNLRNFLRYLGSAWGLLSAFTPIFPLFDRFSGLMPPPESHAELANVLATLGGLFAVFWEYTQREEYMKKHRESKAGWYFLSALVLTVLYAVICYPERQDFAFMQALRELRLIFEPFVYILTFYLFTKSFTILAIQEFGKAYKSEHPGE